MMQQSSPGPVVVSNADREGVAAFLLRMRRAGMTNIDLVKAIEMTPRRKFIDPAYHHIAMDPRTIPIPCGEVLEGLDLQARVIDEMYLETGHRVLEVGTGTGFTACVMARLAKRIHTVERYKTLHHAALQCVRHVGISNIIATRGDGSSGVAGGPYDRIVSWAAFDSVPRAFVEHLASNGMMICAIGPADGAQDLVRMTKIGSRFEREDIGTVRFQPIQLGLPATL